MKIKAEKSKKTPQNDDNPMYNPSSPPFQLTDVGPILTWDYNEDTNRYELIVDFKSRKKPSPILDADHANNDDGNRDLSIITETDQVQLDLHFFSFFCFLINDFYSPDHYACMLQ